MGTLQELVSLSQTVAKGLGEVANPLYLKDIEDMAPCSGGIVQKGLEKVAVYADEKGEKHLYRAVCPHMVRVHRPHVPLVIVDHDQHDDMFSR
jgi:hypothetical protein